MVTVFYDTEPDSTSLDALACEQSETIFCDDANTASRGGSTENHHQRNPGKACVGPCRIGPFSRKKSPNLPYMRGNQYTPAPLVEAPLGKDTQPAQHHPEKVQFCAIGSTACKETPFLRKEDRKAFLLYGPRGTARRLGLYFHLRESVGAAEMDRTLARESAVEKLYQDQHGAPCVLTPFDKEHCKIARERIWTIRQFCLSNNIAIDEFLLMDAVFAALL